ncbi:MAG: YoaP domain-containing protein [Bryobacteraceae bacterium]|jgi:GNAT superfamily N-acetyltransferase
MQRQPRLIDVDETNFDTLPCCGIKSTAHPGRQQKHCWLQANAEFGLRAKMLLAPDGQPSGYIEYLRGEFAWRGVEATGFMFVHCVWIFSKRHQRKGWGSIMVEGCLEDARKAGMLGAAVMVRDGPWLADRRLFLANGFELVDTAPPDYQLLVRKFHRGAVNPTFKKGWDQKLGQYNRGLTIIRSSQCPHIAKFAAEIIESAEIEYGIKPTVVDLKSWSDAQNAPTPYANFALIYNGRLLADHQTSRTRFRNIMKKCLAQQFDMGAERQSRSGPGTGRVETAHDAGEFEC